MALFFDVKVTTTDGGTKPVAGVVITQVATGVGTRRNYRVEAWRRAMRTEERIEQATIIVDHDRELPVWELIRKALEGLK